MAVLNNHETELLLGLILPLEVVLSKPPNPLSTQQLLVSQPLVSSMFMEKLCVCRRSVKGVQVQWGLSANPFTLTNRVGC